MAQKLKFRDGELVSLAVLNKHFKQLDGVIVCAPDFMAKIVAESMTYQEIVDSAFKIVKAIDGYLGSVGKRFSKPARVVLVPGGPTGIKLALCDEEGCRMVFRWTGKCELTFLGEPSDQVTILAT